eukprot:CAMPEP_0119103018 /NCGR_PEP_ID=MMETSP1180-20130426/1574_1 /TAXON_ID=3052 ORGANISM="Chlamydomonas cf sp, Strain CCMP681" /NCGR_SAMPLE_ID=MMETSP1180 /ASSEMBLY_ACC=CAM_ASM_000741 /LENGTH=178 /DNA_ID=CAMNT_0007087427 /DNA_START=290 /DNA_END=826 /DNA_ORIENTATION=+
MNGAPQGGAQGAAELEQVPSTQEGTLISKTEIAAFIQRDDMMDQMVRWSVIEAGASGVRNFGLPMNVTPFYTTVAGETTLWGYKLGIFREGVKLCDLGIMFDKDVITKHEFVGRGDDGFPTMEGKMDTVYGKHFEIWKLDKNVVDEGLRSAIRAYCNGLVVAMNRYYSFGSVFVDDAQ